MLRIRFFAIIALCLSITFQAQAGVIKYIMPDYYLGFLVRGILILASQVGYPQYQTIKDPSAQAKAQASINAIYANPAFKYTYDNILITIVRGNPGEPNGFAFGSNIFITQSLVEILSHEELTAVVAHELAHTEKAHALQKAPLPLEAVFFQVENIIESIREKKWPQNSNLLQSIRNLIETGGLAMELQADCIAAQQLDFMRSRGLNYDPLDLVRATNKIVGFETQHSFGDDPTAIRSRAVISEFYKDGSCDIF